ncbi:helix-turn-helix domain-containing protein [Bifidobacterium sp. MA2]|uniref:Helix-turn-helix domain-containing protein n=1 Tax=Bifidobacterium santillanense TaxID=2809028 RepID=A0ABS5URP8_9BIFI|nr:PucR family transcriptional regulator [Bifidobacterium santillanense]MBT1173647.1 helix-turn-helix domain-containing protein [Bifidobacterium santillanense]
MSDFLGLLTSYADRRADAGEGDGRDGDADARALLTRVAFESLADGLSDERVASLLRVIGWDGDFPCFAIAGRPAANAVATMQTVSRAVVDLGGGATVCGVRDGVVAAVVRVEAAVSPEVLCTAVSTAFAPVFGDADAASNPFDRGDGVTVCLGPVRHGATGAVAALGAALATLKAAPALARTTGGEGARSAAARGNAPLRAEDALPERALLGDPDARRELVDVVYASLAGGNGSNPDDPTMLTVSTFLASGGSLETTARTLNVHPNTVRYRLKRAADSTGWDATDPREAYVLTTAIALGRMHAA